MSQPNNTGTQPIAYLVSQYPATSHTFILREVTGLRRGGFNIVTASINADHRPFDSITAEEQAERGKRGRKRVEMHFDWCRKISAAEELYREIEHPVVSLF